MPPTPPTNPALHDALVSLNRWLRDGGYRFTTVTPASHARVLARGDVPARNLRDIFGWSRPFAAGLLDDAAFGWLRQGGLLQADDHAGTGDGPLWRSRVRFSTLGPCLYAHSAYPTDAADAVFFGPDTYRFAALIESELARHPLRPGARILDVGCGSGAGGIVAALHPFGAGGSLVLADINPAALCLAGANAEAAGVRRSSCVEGDLFAPLEGAFDLILANPPYLVDGAGRAYRHGGGALGFTLSERIVAEGAPRLAPGGRLVLYTGAPIVDGNDPFRAAAERVLARSGWSVQYRELDPDVFGEELAEPAYADVERIAAVALVVQRPG